MANVCKDRAFLGSGKRVRIGFIICAGRNAEETVFRVDGIQSAVRTFSDPGNIIAYAPNFIAFLLISLRRNEHSKVGLAAGAWESGADIFDLAVWLFNAQDKHMLCLPHLVFTKVRRNTKREALFAEQNISAVCGVYGNDGVILRELADPSLFGIYVALAVHAANPVV